MKKLLLSLLIFTVSTPVLAQPSDTLNGFVGAGVFITPEYEGSEDMQAVPLLAARVNYNQYYIQTQGLGLRANISPIEVVEFGPALGYRFGRDDDVDNNVIARLSEIDDALEAGAFIRIPLNNVLKERDELAFEVSSLTDVSNAHEGTLISFGPSYSYQMNQRVRLTTSVTGTYASDDYMESYYSIGAADSAASGLNRFNAEGGIKNAGITLIGNYAFNERWGLIGLIGYDRLMGDAKDSPIVTNQGDENQLMGGIGISYRF